MKKNLASRLTIILSLAVLLSASLTYKAEAAEFVIINKTIEWDGSSPYCFYWFDYNSSTMPSNWISPNNYYNGKIYTRFEIISQPSSMASMMQFGIWQYQPDTSYGELMEDLRVLNGPGDFVESSSTPSTWYKKLGGVDFSKPHDFRRLGINLWSQSPRGYIAPVEHWGGEADVWALRNNFFTMRAKVTVVAVSQGSTFSGWANYLGQKPPTPNYSVDYNGEQTNKVVPSSDEYSYSSNMSGAVSGNGSKLALTPGQDVYFRTKASGYNPKSDIQHVTVPSRPSAPSATINYPAETTVENIASLIEYSTSSNMSGATSGNGSAIVLNPGQDVYFRQKAGGSFFRSAVFHLDVPSRPAPPSVSINYPNELTNENIASTVEYADNISMTSLSHGDGSPLVVVPGTDIFFRLAATSTSFKSAVSQLEVPQRPATPSISIDYQNELSSTIPNDLEWSVNPTLVPAPSGADTSISISPGIDLYFRVKKNNDSFMSLAQKLEVDERLAAPEYSINFIEESTKEAVSSADSYSLNSDMSEDSTGNDMPLALEPGTIVYFRTNATASAFKSEIQSLVVPERPPAAKISIDFENESTEEIMDSLIVISPDKHFTMADTVINEIIPILPQQKIFYRKLAVETSFKSDTFNLSIPRRFHFIYAGPDTIDGNFVVQVDSIDAADSVSFDLSQLSITNGLASRLTHELTFLVEPDSNGVVSLHLPVNSLPDGNFISDTVSVFYYNPIIIAQSLLKFEDVFNIYPNPTSSGFVSINLKSEIGGYTLSVFNLNGEVLLVKNVNNTDYKLNLSSYTAGMYLIKIETREHIYSTKLILE